MMPLSILVASRDGFRPSGFVKIVNKSCNRIPLEGWSLKFARDKKFIFPRGAMLNNFAPNAVEVRLGECEETDATFSVGLDDEEARRISSKGSKIELFSSDGKLVETNEFSSLV